MVVMVVVGWWRCVALHGGIVRLIPVRYLKLEGGGSGGCLAWLSRDWS